jgi:ketosteroid isomerase-like protein
MKHESATPAERERLLFANESFYAAFNAGSAEAMAQVWVTEGPAFCLHPGWPLLQGIEAVLESWTGIFHGGNTPRIECRGAVAEPLGGFGVVLCYEVLGGSVLAATNVFRREAGGWRLLHHQAGPCQQPPAEVLRKRAPQPVQ